MKGPKQKGIYQYSASFECCLSQADSVFLIRRCDCYFTSTTSFHSLHCLRTLCLRLQTLLLGRLLDPCDTRLVDLFNKPAFTPQPSPTSSRSPSQERLTASSSGAPSVGPSRFPTLPSPSSLATSSTLGARRSESRAVMRVMS